MKYVIYLAIAALVVWAVVYLVISIRRQLKGGCASCGGTCSGCGGDCSGCGAPPSKK